MRHAIGSTIVASLILSFYAGDASAQAVAQGEIVVPIINSFTIGTTISVPDRGYGTLGGVRRASDIRNEFGPGFLNRGIASSRSAADAGVRVWIHNFEELEPGGRHATSSTPPPTGFAARIRQYSERDRESVAQNRQDAVGDVRAANANVVEAEHAIKNTHAADLLKRGHDAEERGKLKIAALYYKSVVSLGGTTSAQTARERLTSLEVKLVSR